jgi:hypothetical protein
VNIEVYRLEHPQSQKGPFYHLPQVGTDYALWLEQRLKATSTHLPSVEDDIPGFVSGVHVCGAPDVETISNWFGYYWNRLLAYGFKLYRYTVPNLDTQKGKAQIIFDPKTALARTEVPIGRNMVSL